MNDLASACWRVGGASCRLLEGDFRTGIRQVEHASRMCAQSCTYGLPLRRDDFVGLEWAVKTSRRAGMIAGMTTSKIAVSLPSELVEQAQRAVADGRAASVSAYVARALEEQAKLDDLAALLDEMLTETGGPLTASERRAADRALGR